MKKMFRSKAILSLLLGIFIGASIMFCIAAMAWPEHTSTVQTVDTEMENHARRFMMKIEMENEMPINYYKFSGSCGDLVNWYLTEEGTLYLQGEGAMWDYAESPFNDDKSPVPPWYDYREEITTLVVMPGIASIGGNAFYKCVNLKECTFPDSLREIRYGAFRYCDGLTEVALPDMVSEIGFSAFMGCDNLTTINIPSAMTKLSGLTFIRCHNLRQLTIPASISTIEYGCFSYCGNLTLVFEGSNPTWVLNELNANLFFDDTRVEICYPASDESWKDFSPEGMGGIVFLTPYSKDNSLKLGSRLCLGDTVMLGCYEQDGDPANGSEPIQWVVKAVDGDRVFLTTVENLTVRSSDETVAEVSWESAELKIWMNTEFYPFAFTQAEQDLLQSTTYHEIECYCNGISSEEIFSEEAPDPEICQVGFCGYSKSFGGNEFGIVLYDLLTNPVIVVTRDCAFAK